MELLYLCGTMLIVGGVSLLFARLYDQRHAMDTASGQKGEFDGKTT